ncbi:hypothetical protein BH765_gp60 [Gordonia phage Kvothe]|uniref:Uncharacterized protein n=1 Tax=Gordonia phage Kvothe TaxID=1838071 RepID=A0A166Y7C9_9CAUD|nr:hypothetical protein BH765_gp60 [Gordonia phage Kvothe]ANA86123.1 hypothetical protein PBI_KVOTHE_60 [Gordonia phage Kvothe]
MDTLEEERKRIPLFSGAEQVYIRFHTFQTARATPEAVQKMVRDIEKVYNHQRKKYGNGQKAVIVSPRAARDMFPFVHAEFTPFLRNGVGKVVESDWTPKEDA